MKLAIIIIFLTAASLFGGFVGVYPMWVGIVIPAIVVYLIIVIWYATPVKKKKKD